MSTGSAELAIAADPEGQAQLPLAQAGRLRRRRKLSRKMIAGSVILGAFVVMAIIGRWVAPYGPSALSSDTLAGPSSAHLLGTTQTGQDVLSQLLAGAGTTLEVGFLAAAIATALSVVVGVSAGYFQGVAGELLSMLSNIFLVIPALPLLVVLNSFLPHAGSIIIALIISVTSWAWGARVLRAQTLTLVHQDYIRAAKAVGEPAWRIIFWELLPNELAIVASSFLFTVIAAILADAGLLYLGLGNTNTWSWGSILYWSQNSEALTAGAWWWFVPPGVCIALLGFGLALMNFGIDELINPRLRSVGLSRADLRTTTTGMGVTPVHPTHAEPTPVAGGSAGTVGS